MAVVINSEAFGKRLGALRSAWQDDGGWGVSAIAVAVGAAAEDDENRYHKSSSLHLWLLGYEFTDTILVLTKDELHALAGQKKTELLAQVEQACAEAGLTLRTHIKPKKEDGSKQIQELIDVLKASGDAPAVGTLPEEKLSGAFAGGWASALAASGLEVVDVASHLADIMSPKDEEEVKNVKKAAYLASQTMATFAVQQIEGIIDEEKKVRHTKLALKAAQVIAEPSKIGIKLKADVVDVAYPPLFQSGGQYNLNLLSKSNDKYLHYGVIICALGARYASYCANIARTYFVDPNQQQQDEYVALQEAHAAAVAALVEGASMSAAYEAVVKVLEGKGLRSLLDKLPANVGSAIGLELQDSTQELSSANQKAVKAGMTFNVSLGITDLTRDDAADEEGKKYALLIADTVIVTRGGTLPEIATSISSKDWKEVAYYLKSEDAEQDAEEQRPRQDQELGMRKSSRTEHVDFKMKEDERRRQKENQVELLERVNQATLQMLNKGGMAGTSVAGTGRKITDLVAYKSISDMQHNNTLSVQVDHKSECVLVPVYGVLVPFHILTLRNASFNQDGDHAYIRINFNFGPSYEPGVKFPASVFLKELSFRSADLRHAAKVVQEIKSLRSAVQQREKERAERATLVQQERLVRSKGRVYTLPDVWIRPAFGGKGRKVTGTLEAHANGFRYTSPKGEELDVMYRNIKHAFFQPADNEMITLVHFHLTNPIMVGKKKTHDVQFYTEVMDSVQTLDAGRRSMYDPDEIEEEQRERERRNQINKQFSQFVKRVQMDLWERDFGDLNLEFEVPFRELGFFGVPARSNCFIMPTVNCLVELTELPFTAITLPEVNLVSLERVGFNLRNFDMILIWKDLNRDVARIDSIPSKYLDTIKDWLTSIDIKYFESKVNLNWKNILKSIKEDPEGFVEAGGWNFLDADQSDSEDEDGEEESDFAPSGDDDASAEEESSEDESLVDSEDDEEGSDYEVDSAEEEGLDWDALEEKARAEDKEAHFSDEEEAGRKRKLAGKSGDRKRARN